MELVCLPLGEGGVSQTCNYIILLALVWAVPGPVCSYVFKSKSLMGRIQVCLSFSHTASCMHGKKHWTASEQYMTREMSRCPETMVKCNKMAVEMKPVNLRCVHTANILSSHHYTSCSDDKFLLFFLKFKDQKDFVLCSSINIFFVLCLLH